MCLQRVPAFVYPLHCTVVPSPCALLGEELEEYMLIGVQILQGCRPSSFAYATVICSETFFTMRQVAVWYLAPEGVL